LHNKTEVRPNLQLTNGEQFAGGCREFARVRLSHLANPVTHSLIAPARPDQNTCPEVARERT